jgi:hypothetical protein
MTAKADRVQSLINDPDLKEAFQNVRERYRDLIETTPLNSKDTGALHDVRKMLHLLKEVEKDLHTAIQNGHLEDSRALEQEKHSFLGDLWNRKKVQQM